MGCICSILCICTPNDDVENDRDRVSMGETAAGATAAAAAGIIGGLLAVVLVAAAAAAAISIIA
jgi:hypothetical protein